MACTSTSKIKYFYDNTIKQQYWEQYLSRNLTKKEKNILCAVKNEKLFNDNIKKIYEKAKIDGLYIPELTPLDGNCLFESLRILGLFNDSSNFRIGFSQLLLLLKNVPNFLPGCNEPLCQLFTNFNEIGKVKCSKTGRVYVYNYDAMCVDLSGDGNWTRLNTELLLRVLCMLLNINIKIYNQNGHITNVNDNTNENTITYYIGQIGASNQTSDSGFHFVPLKLYEGNEFPKCLIYTENLKEYHNWAQSMAKLLGKFTIE